MDACLQIICGALRSPPLMCRHLLHRFGDEESLFRPLTEMPPWYQRSAPHELMLPELRVHSVRQLHEHCQWLQPRVPDWDELDSLDDHGDPIVHPDALDVFLRREITDDRPWAMVFMPECERLGEKVHTDAAGALARLRAHFTGERRDGFAAFHLP